METRLELVLHPWLADSAPVEVRDG